MGYTIAPQALIDAVEYEDSDEDQSVGRYGKL
jgi:hypothetical protein